MTIPLKMSVFVGSLVSFGTLLATDASLLGKDFATHFMQGIMAIVHSDDYYDAQVVNSEQELAACVALAIQLPDELQKRDFCLAALKALEHERIPGLAGAFIEVKNGYERPDLIKLLTVARMKHYIVELLREITATESGLVIYFADQSEKALFSFKDTKEAGGWVWDAYFRAGLSTLKEGGFPCCESREELINMPSDWQKLLMRYFFPMPFDDICIARVNDFLEASKLLSDQ